MNPAATRFPERAPRVGELVEVRSRRWLVEAVEDVAPPASPRVSLACADDDAQGQALEVYWDFEIDRRILEQEAWSAIGARGFDLPRFFSAFLHTLRWNCVTATDPNLFQSPFRAGIRIDAYQMEPLRKALRLPRVNLFIADDTGLGKTIEAGLIARELLLRKKAKTVVVAAPASVLEQWKAEMEERFGLLFVILDRAYLARVRQERGFGVNPWRTHSRFLVSHNLLIDPVYADPMREWLGEMQAGGLLILDEAHHAAPSSGGRYGIETKFTRAIRDLGGRFEHRLFLSATPHNGHSNSFSTLLELLDPYRFTRGVPVRGKSALEEVMVRRIKEDVRRVQGGFPEREVRRIAIEDLPEDAPELVLSRLLDEYRGLRDERLKHGTARARAAAGLLVVGLQQKLLSSIEAFAISLARHRVTVRRQWEEAMAGGMASPGSRGSGLASARSFAKPPDADDERAEYSDDEREAEEAVQIDVINAAAEGDSAEDAQAEAIRRKEEALLARMEEVASDARGLPDAKTRRLIDWIRENLCPELPLSGERSPGNAGILPAGDRRSPSPDEPPTASPPRWNERRVLIFTENVIGTKRYLREMLEQAIAGTHLAEERIETIDGQTVGAKRKEIQRRFNADPARDPLRILLATDAAREGLNFQAHCTDLFHFDLPWNPGRIEQRNGRIDRKLQPAPKVVCHYFVLSQREEDRVLEVLVRKTETIKRELGSLSKVIDDDVERRLRGGIRHRDAKRLAREIEAADLDRETREKKRVAAEELEAARERQDDLVSQIERCRGLLERSRRWVQFSPEPFRDAMSCSLELMGAAPLQEDRSTENGEAVWTFPPLAGKAQADASWTATLDTLRAPRKTHQKLAEWRRENPGFDAFVGNPPFLGGTKISSNLGKAYLDWVLALHDESHGNADIVGHFFRRSFNLIRLGGTIGLIATNTIAQGDTRSSSLRWICKNGGDIYRATNRFEWPGDAAVVVSVLHILKGEYIHLRSLDGLEVKKITAFLFHRAGHDDPLRLVANGGCSFTGVKIYGQGFTFDDTDRKDVASPLAEMRRLIEANPHNHEAIFPYIGGEEVNKSPTHAHHRHVINFRDYPLRREDLGELWRDAGADQCREWLRKSVVPLDYPEPVAVDWLDLLEIVEERVKPERMKVNRKVRRDRWWQFGDRQPALSSAIDGLERVLLVNCGATPHLALTFLSAHMVFAHSLVVFSLQTYAAFCILQSRPHEIWARFFGSSMKDDLRYTPSDCFETFPFPDGWETHPSLEAAGKAYYEHRAALMVRNDEGMTKTYNRFHDPYENASDIGKLRELHTAMDRAVLDAYGWTDIPTDCDFLLDYEIDEATWGRKKKPYRYRWPDPVRDEVLARLLALNAERAAEEARAGASATDAVQTERGAARPAAVRNAPAVTTQQRFSWTMRDGC